MHYRNTRRCGMFRLWVSVLLRCARKGIFKRLGEQKIRFYPLDCDWSPCNQQRDKIVPFLVAISEFLASQKQIIKAWLQADLREVIFSWSDSGLQLLSCCGSVLNRQRFFIRAALLWMIPIVTTARWWPFHFPKVLLRLAIRCKLPMCSCCN